MKNTGKKITFRVDASIQIGTGHFMRCLTLAEELRKCDAQVRFISRHLPPHLSEMLAVKEIEFVPLESAVSVSVGGDLTHSHWLGISQADDAQAAIQALSDQTWDWLIVDHYALDQRWEAALRDTCDKILVVDDLADRQHDCDVLLDSNFYIDMEMRYERKVPAHCQLLLGPRYSLLRSEFRKLRERVRPRIGSVKRVLVFFGGVDGDNYTEQAIQALASGRFGNLIVDVVIGIQHPHRAKIEALCLQYGFSCHVQTDRMAELMSLADLAIGAGGSATWERCCLGLPTLTICTAANQQKQVADAASAGLLFAPEMKEDLQLLLDDHLHALMENNHLRQFVSFNAMQAVDVHGLSRVMSTLGCSNVDMRIAKDGDSKKLFEWRNHPSIRAVSRNVDMIDWENHQKWWGAVMEDNNKVLLVGEREGVPIGVVRFDQQETYAEISIYLVPGTANLGQGQNLLVAAEQWIAANRSDITHVRAIVLGNNIPSHRLFLRGGYQVESTHYLKKIN